MTKKSLITFIVVSLLNTVLSASDLGICTIDNKRPITLTYRGNVLVIDGKYTAKMVDGDILISNGKHISYVRYDNRKYSYFVETIDGQDQLTVISSKYIHGMAVDQDRSEIVYSCKWYK